MNFVDGYTEKSTNANFQGNPTMRPKLFHANGQTDGHDAANSHFSQFFERSLKFKSGFMCFVWI